MQDFEIEDFEVLAQETIDVEDLDDLMAEGLGDTSKVRRVPFKIDEDHYLKLQCRKPPFDFFIRRNEQGFLNLSQVRCLASSSHWGCSTSVCEYESRGLAASRCCVLCGWQKVEGQHLIGTCELRMLQMGRTHMYHTRMSSRRPKQQLH